MSMDQLLQRYIDIRDRHQQFVKQLTCIPEEPIRRGLEAMILADTRRRFRSAAKQAAKKEAHRYHTADGCLERSSMDKHHDEHPVPLCLIHDALLGRHSQDDHEKPPVSTPGAALAQFLKTHLFTVRVTENEHRKVLSGNSMPREWHWWDDPMSRYKDRSVAYFFSDPLEAQRVGSGQSDGIAVCPHCNAPRAG